MSMPDFPLDATLDFKFTTRAFASGVPFTLAGTPVISAYKDNSLTQITAGITLTVDFDGVTGLNNVRIAATAANGFASGESYALVITTGTVDGVSVVGEVVQQFTIQRQSADVRAWGGTTTAIKVSVGSGLPEMDAAQVSTAAIGPASFAAGAINNAAIAANAISETELADGTITAPKFGPDAITAAVIAPAAIDAAAIAANALDNKGNWNIGKTGYDLNADQSGVTIGTVTTVTDTVGANVTFWQGIPQVAVNGKPNVHTSELANDTITAVSIAAAALNGKGDWNIGKTGYNVTSGTVDNVTNIVTANVTTWQGFTIPGAAMIEDDGAGAGRWTTKALEQTPASAGGTDWTVAEREQFRDALGINGDKTAATGGQLQNKADTGAEMNLADNAITAAKVAGGALNGKGDWNIGKTGYDLNPDQIAVSIGSCSLVAQVTNMVTANLIQWGGIAVSSMVEDVAGARYTTKALEQAPSGGDVNVTQWAGTAVTPLTVNGLLQTDVQRIDGTQPKDIASPEFDGPQANIERPASGSVSSGFQILILDWQGQPIDPDGATDPDRITNLNLVATALSGADRTANISGVSRLGQGLYGGQYDVASTHAFEQVALSCNVLKSGLNWPQNTIFAVVKESFDPNSTILVESYAADGQQFTLAQSEYMKYGLFANMTNVGTTQSVYRLNKTTVAMTFAYDDADNPTSRFRAT